MTKTKPAFTIVELLIVIVVIAILAAISIVAFNGIQDRARSSAAQSAAAQAVKKIVAWQVDNPDSAPTCGQFNTLMTNNQSPPTDCSFTNGDIAYQYSQGGNGVYCATVTNGTKSYKVSNTATTPSQGGCAGHGQGGVAAITNLARDPRATNSTAEWQNRYGASRSFITNVSDGPLSNVNSYMRQTFSTSNTGSGRGTDHRGNMDTSPQADTSWPVQANETISAITYLRASIASNDARIICRIHDGAGNWLTPTTNSNSFNAPATQWTKVSLTFTASVSGYLACSSRYVSTLTWSSGATLDTTALMINKQSSSSYADGESPNWIWNGTPNNSTSTGPAL